MSQVAGLATAGVGVYVLFMKAEYEELIGSSLIVIAAYIAIGGGGIVAFIALAGCAGALTENRKLLILVKYHKYLRNKCRINLADK